MNRKKWSNEEKVTVVLEMIKGVDSVGSICARHGVSATQAYKWQEQFLSGGRAALSDKRQKENLNPVVDENRKLKELVGQQALVIEAQKKLNGILPRR
jgi:transposase-like protein